MLTSPNFGSNMSTVSIVRDFVLMRAYPKQDRAKECGMTGTGHHNLVIKGSPGAPWERFANSNDDFCSLSAYS
jgi:hypothetical protein